VVKRNRVLTDDELRAIWQASLDMDVFGAVVRVLILTGQRRDEVASMVWTELSPDHWTWTIPGELKGRTKNKLTHIVPLPAMAREIIDAQPRLNANLHVFIGRKGGPFRGFGFAKAALDKACGIKNWRIHDLRRSFATQQQRIGTRLEVTEALLNHVSGSRGGIAGVYQQHDWAEEKKAAMKAWDRRFRAIIAGLDLDEASNITDLVARRAAH
jgi:integrase